MKKYLFVAAAIIFSFYAAGCGKKQPAMEESQEAVSMESLSTVGSTTSPATEAKVETAQATAPAGVVTKLEPLPPAGPYKPSVMDIQTALKNAGIYTGPVDGKIGPKTKKAIEAFQNANGLKVDGKVGTKTWELLSKNLNPAQGTARPAKKR